MKRVDSSSSALRVLVVDDNAINRDILGILIEDFFSIIPEFAANGALALECARTRHYDLILMDIFMPEMNGVEAAGKISALPAYVAAPSIIVGLTADYSLSLQQECIRAGMVACYSKPFDTDSLRDLLTHYDALASKFVS